MAGAASVAEAVDLGSWTLAPLAGIIPRSAVEVFRVLEERSALNAYEVELSMYELYRDALRDLFAPPAKGKPAPLAVKLAQFTKSGLVEVGGARSRTAASLGELVQHLEAGAGPRVIPRQ